MTPAECVTLIKDTAEACAQLADGATCPRDAATRIRARFRLLRPSAPETGPVNVAARLARGEWWCVPCQDWHPGACPARFLCHGCGAPRTSYGLAFCRDCLRLGRETAAPVEGMGPEWWPCHLCGKRTAAYGSPICDACRFVLAQR